MNRILLGLVCCTPLLFNLPVQSVELIGPNDEVQTPQQTVEAASTPTTSTATPSIAPTKYGPIRSAETLWSIASKLRPNNNVSVYQTLAAIYKLNPTAFRQGDINKIIETSVINVPSLALISAQSNTEAYKLLKPSPKPTPKVTPQSKVSNTEPKNSVEKNDKVVKSETTEAIDSTFLPIDELNVEGLQKNLEDKELALVRNELQVADQEKELALLSEQLILATESNQRLKLKLQPLSDQIASLSEQVEEDIKVQKELQDLIDQYRAQLDAIVESPFGGPGLLNTILRAISSSTSVLIFAILFPLLLLTGIFLLILRLKSKRELASRQQELAESTAIIDEEKSEFDTLLDDDDLDLPATPESQENTDFIEDAPSEVLPEETIFDDIKSEDDNVEELANTELIDKETSDNDVEDISTTELDFDIDAMIDGSDEVIDLSEEDFNLDNTDQKDLDLAAEWESELAELESEQAGEIPLNETTEQNAVELEDSEIVSPESLQEPIELDLSDDNIEAELNEQLAESSIDAAELPEETSDDVIESLGGIEETSDDVTESLEGIEETSDDVIESLESIEETSDDVTESLEGIEETSDDVIESLENIEKSTDDVTEQSKVDEDIRHNEEELSDEDQNEDDSEAVDADTLAKQLSAGAFNEEVSLPSFDKNDDKDFIDINTLLTGDEGNDLTEEDFNLEFGLDEFPDVVDSFTEFDTDADGVAAQLDLAHAYLEIDEKEGAKAILTKLLETAPEEKLKEVKKLLARIS